jgi:carbon monoxide dehydrogenase subunit G
MADLVVMAAQYQVEFRHLPRHAQHSWSQAGEGQGSVGTASVETNRAAQGRGGGGSVLKRAARVRARTPCNLGGKAAVVGKPHVRQGHHRIHSLLR